MFVDFLSYPFYLHYFNPNQSTLLIYRNQQTNKLQCYLTEILIFTQQHVFICQLYSINRTKK